MKFQTRAIHAGQSPDRVTGATIPPIHMTTTFTQDGIGLHKGYEYSRTGNPTRESLEVCLASLEGGRFGLAFASGSAATAAVASMLKSGDHVVAAEDMYGGTRRLFDLEARRTGAEFTYVDSRSAVAVESAITLATRLVWIETPTNPLLHITDIAGIAAVTRRRGIRLAVDNTFATPWLQNPLSLGADIVVHSTTKYINGHSDAVGGIIVTDDPTVHEAFRFYQNAAGAVPGPFESWLTLRGLKTLAVRMERHCRNALHVARFLNRHSSLERVIYPGLESHPGHVLAARQMRGFGGMVTIELKGGLDAVERFVMSLQVFSYAESLGGVESLACHPDTMTHCSIPLEERRRRGIGNGLVRLSVGLEDPEDLTADLDRALRYQNE